MVSWAGRKADEMCQRGFALEFGSKHRAFTVLIRETIEEAARRCEDTDVVEAPRRDTYYAQLGDGRATLQEAARSIRAMLADDGAEKDG